MKKLLAIIGLAVGLMAIVMVVVSKPAVAPTPDAMPAGSPGNNQIQSSTTTEKLPTLIIGQPNAKVTIVEYSDFQCPICLRFFIQTEPQLIKDYINTGKAKIEFRVETHLGEASALAGEAAYCANDQDKFKDYHDSLFFNQGKLQFTSDNLKQLAGNIGLDKAGFDSCLDDRKYRQVVEDSNREAQTKISGTPTFFIGQQKIVGAQPYSVLKPLIEAELGAAK